MATSAISPPPQLATLEEYLALPEGSRVQLIDGELIDMLPSPTYRHQTIAFEIATLLRQFAKERQLGVVCISPLDVIIGERQALQPDVLFISNENKAIIGERINGAPNLVVEVLSPSTAQYDLMNKMRIYATAGVTEYWIVDPEDQTVRFYDNRQGTFAEFDYLSIHKTVASSKLLAGLEVAFDVVFDVK